MDKNGKLFGKINIIDLLVIIIAVAVVAAVANGCCAKDSDVTVRVKGGDLVVHYTDEKVTLTGDAKLVYTGEIEY